MQHFGESVSISNTTGDRLAIGPPLGGGLQLSGKVDVYERAGGQWTQLPSGVTGSSFFDQMGWKVEMNSLGNRLITKYQPVV